MIGLLSLAPRRRRVVQALPPRQRRWVTRQLGRLRGGGARIAPAVRPAASPVQVRRANLGRVMAVLDGAGVPYFRVPHARQQRTALAVSTDDRDRVLAALAAPAMTGAAVRGWTCGPRTRRVPLRDATVVAVHWPVIDPTGAMLIGDGVACEIEFWAPRGDALLSPRRPCGTPLVRRDSPVVQAADRDFDQFCAGLDDGARFPTRRELMLLGVARVRFPVDAVYTACGDGLRYSLRSLHYFAPWIRRVFLVSPGPPPPWLDADHPQLTVVDVRDIATRDAPPADGSDAPETSLHHLHGLAEHFLHLTDDVFFARPQSPDDYFLPGGVAKLLPAGGPGQARQPLRPRRRSIPTEVDRRPPEFGRPDAAGSSSRAPRSYPTGTAAPANLRCLYPDAADPQAWPRLRARLRRRDLDAFCVTAVHSGAVTAHGAALADLLPAVFPFATPYEISDSRPCPGTPLEPAAPTVSRASGAPPGPRGAPASAPSPVGRTPGAAPAAGSAPLRSPGVAPAYAGEPAAQRRRDSQLQEHAR